MMLHFKPYTKPDGQFGYTALDENDGAQAECLCVHEEMYITFLTLECTLERADLAKGVVRSACSYGANRGAFVARAREDAPFTAHLCSLGFTAREGFVEMEIPELLMGNCCATESL